MKIKSQYFALGVILFIGGLFGVLFFSDGGINNLFSRSVNPINDDSTIQGEDPRPAVESLDGQNPEEMVINFDALIAELEKELLETQNDPDKAFELRRRIQILKTQKEISTPETNNS